MWSRRIYTVSWMKKYTWNNPKVQLRSEEHTSELQSQSNLVCRLLLEKKKTACHNGSRRRTPVRRCVHSAPLQTLKPQLRPSINKSHPSRFTLPSSVLNRHRPAVPILH